MDREFLKLLDESRDVHKIIPADWEKSNTARLRKKVASESRLISAMDSLEGWETLTPYAELSVSEEHLFEGKRTLHLSAPSNLPDWPEGHAKGRIYSEPGALFSIDRENWEDWDRLSLWVYPDIHGMKSLCLRLQFHNDGVLKSPDLWVRTGHHNFALKPFEWNHITLEIPMVPRDAVTGISIEYDMCGHENDSDSVMNWYLSTLELQKVGADKDEGWEPRKGLIAISGSGYLPGAPKFAAAEAVLAENEAPFCVLDAESGAVVFDGVSEISEIHGEKIAVFDFSGLRKEGRYIVQAGSLRSNPFTIASDVYEPAAWKVLNFYLSQRCGCHVPGKHRACHTDLLLVHGKKSIVANGGWHDAADLAQGMGNTADGTAALFLLSDRLKEKNPRLYERVLEEAVWGLDYVLKVRFGDGFRSDYSSSSIWTDGIIGTEDDIISVANEMPFANFASAFAEACAAYSLKDSDPVYADYSLKIAKEDFGFAVAQMDRAFAGDTTVHSELFEIKLFSAACSAAAALVRAGAKEYTEEAARFAALQIECQEKDTPDWELPLSGFYYTDRAHSMPWHHAHHSFEQYTAAGLEMLLTILPEHRDAKEWRAAVERTAAYYKTIAKFTAPYYMIPEGVYFADEGEKYPDEVFRSIIWADETCLPGWRRQTENGIICLDREKGVYLRAFPVWFSFRGNANVQLSEGIAIASAARLLGDSELQSLAELQINWLTGLNPTGQSMIYGEGYDWTDEYTVQPGVTVGEIPVGMETYLENDAPFWPQVTTATYKEVWIASANKFIWLLSYIL